MDVNPHIFRRISYGLYLIGSTKDGRINAQIANTFFQITSDPATVAIGINKNNLTHDYIKSSGVFTASILSESVSLELIGHFGFKSGRNVDKFATITFKLGETGAPYLTENSVAYLEAKVINSVDTPSHTLFIGKVINGALLNEEEPLTYADYHLRKTGTQPAERQITPSVKGPESIPAPSPGQKYQCAVCSYIYDPAVGDPDSGIAPGTPFADIPDDWVCPICGVSKDQFDPLF